MSQVTLKLDIYMKFWLKPAWCSQEFFLWCKLTLSVYWNTTIRPPVLHFSKGVYIHAVPFYCRGCESARNSNVFLWSSSSVGFFICSRWSGDGGLGWKILTPYPTTAHGQHVRGEVRARRVYLNVHSVTGNVVDTEWSIEFWRWKWCREFGNKS